MAAKIIPVATFDCVVFGATGDLTLRKLLPALYYRSLDGQIPADSRIVGAALQEIARDPDVARALFDVLEAQKLVEGKADITLIPEGNNLLKQLQAAEAAPAHQPLPPKP
jgi:glucose-6-phosphate 1-dehydrogenase